MTKEEKQLLFKDLCSRLPYGVRMYTKENGKDASFILRISDLNYIFDKDRIDVMYDYDGWKPYLRSMSNMTKKEFDEYMRFIKHSWEGINKEEDDYYIKVKDRDIYTDWLLSHHFDHRGLIEKGLALEAKEGMYKF